MRVKKIMCIMKMCTGNIWLWCKYNLGRSQKTVKKKKEFFYVATSAAGTSTVFEATKSVSKDWFKNFKNHFNLHNMKLIEKEVSVEYVTEKVFPTKVEM